MEGYPPCYPAKNSANPISPVLQTTTKTNYFKWNELVKNNNENNAKSSLRLPSFTTRAFDPPFPEIRVRGRLRISTMQHRAQLTLFVITSVDLVIFPPLEIRAVEFKVLPNTAQEKSQVLGRLEAQGVHEGPRWRQLVVLGATESDGHHVIFERPVELLGYVVLADAVLEGEEKLVLSGELLEALVGLTRRADVCTACPVDVHIDVFAKFFGVGVPAAVGWTVAAHPDYRSRLIGPCPFQGR